MNCRLCGHETVERVQSLGKAYIADSFCSSPNTDISKYAYDIWACHKCFHVQSFDVLPQEALFGEDYTYIPSSSPSLRRGFEAYIRELRRLKIISSESLLLDIGSNDGLFLDCAQQLTGCRVIGVEPAKGPRMHALKKKINTISRFWGEDAVDEVLSSVGRRVDVVSANNVFAHCSNLKDFAKSVREVLVDDGYFVFEVSYLLSILKKDLVGVYFHEHLSHHSLTSLVPFLRRSGFIVKHAFETESQGGSLVVVCQATESADIRQSSSVTNLLEKEALFGLSDIRVARRVVESFERARSQYELAASHIPAGSRVGIFGASRSLSTFDAFFHILDGAERIYDDNPHKIGRYYPGSNISVQATECIAHDMPDVLIIAAWVPTDGIIEMIRDKYNVKAIIRLLDPISYQQITP